MPGFNRVLYQRSRTGTDCGAVPTACPRESGGRPGLQSYCMHTFRVGVHPMRPAAGLRGPLPPFRRPREGGDPALTLDAAAAGGELAGLPRLPREPRLGPARRPGRRLG